MVVDPVLALPLFSTPVAVFELPEMEETNRELAQRLLAEEQAVPSWKRANVGGWHSAPNLSQRPEACYRKLMRGVVDQISHLVNGLAMQANEELIEQGGTPRPPPRFRYGLTAWAMVLRQNHYVITHDHGDSHWSVAYYVDAGDEDAPPPSGHLVFLDPRRSAKPIPDLELFPTTFELPARTGALVVFPGFLQHYVHAYRGARPRICVSCNVTMDVAQGQ